MSRFNLRKRARVCYYEPEEPPFDEYIFCSHCKDYVYEYCSIHGPLLVIPDDKVPCVTGLPACVPRAALTIPRVFLHIAYSYIPEAGLGVFSSLTLPAGVRFGPYRGRRATSGGHSNYGWQIYDRNHKPLHIVDASDANHSNWMRYVNCARHRSEQNLVAFQYQGELYYRTIKIVPRFTELLVFYGSEFADSLGVDLRAYNRAPPRCVCRHCEARLGNKNEPIKSNNPNTQVQEKEKLFEENKPIRDPVEKLQEPSTSQTQSPTNNDVQVIPTKKSKVKKSTFTCKKSTNGNIPTENNSVPVFKCGQCTKGFDINSDLEKHIQTHDLLKKSMNLNSKFTCKKCSDQFDTKLLLVMHAKSRHGVKYFDCSECEYTTCNKGILQRHLRTHTGERPFKCKQCSAAFNRISSLQRHMRTHTGEKPYECNECSSTFAESGPLKLHLRTHTGEKPYECNQCNATFARSSYLTIHLRTHTGEKPYKCNQCSSTFAYSNVLKSHMRTHTGEKPYKCNQCSSTFAYSNVLKSHMRTHTGEKPYECNICEYKTIQSSNLKSHLMSRHSGQKPHACSTCSYRGATRDNLYHHTKSCHRQT